MADEKAASLSLIKNFKFDRLLNQDQAGRRSTLCGHIDSKPCILILERAPFPSSEPYLSSLPETLVSVQNLGANDIYFWYLANNGASASAEPTDLKINLIYPSTKQHIKKYSKQGVRMVTETPRIYAEKIRPYMQEKRDGGRLNWIYNIIDGKTEVEDVIFRTPQGRDGDEGFLLLPDLNWDRKTMEGMHLLGLVERRDIWSLRDLKKKHIGWLRDMRRKLLEATLQSYKGLDEDQLKLYVHYQPTYYHFHVHIVHVALEAGATQATGKAIGLESIIEQLELMEGDEEAGMDRTTLHYTVGEASELWTDIFEPIKSGTASRPQGQDH